MAVLGNSAPATAAPAQNKQTPPIRRDQELDISQVSETHPVEMRVCEDYFCCEFKDINVMLIARAPSWTVEEISVKRKLYCKTPLKQWLRRGNPLNLINLGGLADWPIVAKKQTVFMKVPATIYALPYLTQQRKIVSLKHGSTGEITALDWFKSTPAGQIQSRLYSTPKADGLTLALRVTDPDREVGTYNPVFIYSGGWSKQPYRVSTKRLSVVKRRPLQSTVGFKTCAESRQVWVNQDETEGLGGLMK